MKLKDKIEENFTLSILGLLFIGFLGGIGSYKAVLEMAQLKVISAEKLDKCDKLLTGGGPKEAEKQGTPISPIIGSSSSQPSGDGTRPIPKPEGKLLLPEKHSETLASASKEGPQVESAETGDANRNYTGKLDVDIFCKRKFGEGFAGSLRADIECQDGLAEHRMEIGDACEWSFGSRRHSIDSVTLEPLCDTSARTSLPCGRGQRLCGLSQEYCCPPLGGKLERGRK